MSSAAVVIGALRDNISLMKVFVFLMSLICITDIYWHNYWCVGLGMGVGNYKSKNR